MKVGAPKGTIPWNKGKRGLQVAWNKNKKMDKPAWNKGTPHTFETRKKMSLTRKGTRLGVNHPRWMGGNEVHTSKKRYSDRMRVATLAALGGICVRCGFSDERALQVDHINGGGWKERKELGGKMKKIVLESILAKENKYQLLCANCNWIKRTENRELRSDKKI